MLSRDYLLAKASQFFETLAKARKALGDKQYELLCSILNENFNESAVTDYLHEENTELSEDAYQYLLFQSELLFLQLQHQKATGGLYESVKKRYLALAQKLLKADTRNFNFGLHQKIISVQQDNF